MIVRGAQRHRILFFPVIVTSPFAGEWAPVGPAAPL